MQYFILAGLLSLVAAAPLGEEKRQTGVAPPPFSFTGTFAKPTGLWPPPKG